MSSKITKCMTSNSLVWDNMIYKHLFVTQLSVFVILFHIYIIILQFVYVCVCQFVRHLRVRSTSQVDCFMSVRLVLL